MEEARRLAEIAPKVMNAFHDLGKQHPTEGKLSMRQYQALIVLHASKTLSLTQFCEKLSLAPSTGTELVNRMIDLKYIQKEGEHADKRQVFLSVTSKGQKLLEQRKQAMTEMFDVFMQRFSDQDKDLFIESFENIWNIIAKYHKKPQRKK